MHVADVDRASCRRVPHRWVTQRGVLHRRLGLGVVLAACLVLSVTGNGLASAQEGDSCTPVLVTHSPQGSTGEERAVAITAQAIDLEEGTGWVNVAWEAAAGVDLTAVSIFGTDGDVRTLTEPGPSGSAVDVDTLVFCGTVDPAVFPPSEPDEPSEPSDPEEDPAPEAPDDDGEPEAGDDGEPPSTEEGDGTSDDGSAAADDPEQDVEPEPVPAPTAPRTDTAPTTEDQADTVVQGDGSAADPTPDPDRAAGPQAGAIAPEEEPDTSVDNDAAAEDRPDGEAADGAEVGATSGDVEEADEEEDVEVLGVQLSRDDEPAGPNWPILLLMLGFGILAVGAGLALWRNWSTH